MLVEDEEPVRQAVERALRREGITVTGFADYPGPDLILAAAPDLAVLDVVLPSGDGFALARELRAARDLPIVFLTARDTVEDRLGGFELGADDYLVKPFALEELLARLRALLRRTVGDEGPLSFADLTLDPGTHEVQRGDRPIELTRTEFLLLELFMRNPRQVLTRDVIFDRVWGYDFGPSSNSLEVYVGYLRRKLEAAGEPRLLHTVRGVGYVLRER